MGRIGIWLALITLCFARAAWADTYTFQPSVGVWEDELNWSPQGIPTYGDRAVIPANKLCIVEEGAHADTVEVASGGELQLAAGLTLWGNFYGSGAITGTSEIDGVLSIFLDILANGELWISDNSHTIVGEGMIIGHGTPTIYIANGNLSNGLATPTQGILGDLKIKGWGSLTPCGFYNEGIVEAGGSITLETLSVIYDSPGAIWATGTCSSLIFNTEAAFLEGDFVGSAASQFVCNQSVVTCGTYTRNEGGITVGSGKVFSYRYFASGTGSLCPGNPGSSACEPVSCACLFEVDTSVASCQSCP